MTQEEIYKRSCDQMEVVKVSYFLRNMYSEVMNLAHHQLGPRGVRAISAPLVVSDQYFTVW